LLHAVLEHFYRGLTTRKLAVTAANLDMILDCLEHSCTVVFAAAPTKLGFRAGVLWDFEQQELRRMLRSLAIWECEQSGAQATYQPYLQEAAFGFEKGTPALEIELEDLRFRLHGFIDRIDRDKNGNLKVIDYKSGSMTYSKPDIEKGLALQTVLYALAAERNWLSLDAQVKESCFLHIPNHKSSGCVVFREKVEENELVETALQQAARNVKLVQEGVFPSAPGKPSSGNLSCRENCDFASICRVSRESIRKARRAGLA
jgi:ATP-dependent helicase/DNAse subunit B